MKAQMNGKAVRDRPRFEWIHDVKTVINERERTNFKEERGEWMTV